MEHKLNLPMGIHLNKLLVIMFMI